MSIRVAPECIPLVEQALWRNGFPSKAFLAQELGLSRSTITSFFNCKPVSNLNFVEICEKLGLPWQELADSSQGKRHIPVKPRLTHKIPLDRGQPAELQTGEGHNDSLVIDDADLLQNFREAPESYNDRGLENYMASQLSEAVSNLASALKLDPNCAEAHYNLGSLYEDLGDFDRARSEYRMAMLGGLAAAYNNLARLHILEKDYRKAVDLLLKGLKLAEHDAEKYALWKNLGWARLEQGRYAEAKACLMSAIDLQREQAAAHCLLAQTLEGQGKNGDALVEWEHCLQYATSYRPDEDPWIDLARIRLGESRKKHKQQ
jgi:tetratricopeptide (TPR) repeat protein